MIALTKPSSRSAAAVAASEASPSPSSPKATMYRVPAGRLASSAATLCGVSRWTVLPQPRQTTLPILANSSRR